MSPRAARLSPTQRTALARLAAGPFDCGRAGWGPRSNGNIAFFSTATMRALERRRLIKVGVDPDGGRLGTAKITAAGRAALRALRKD